MITFLIVLGLITCLFLVPIWVILYNFNQVEDLEDIFKDDFWNEDLDTF